MKLIIQVLEHSANLICMLFLMRILLQLAQADFNNPISQFVHKFTYPIINPLRRIIPDLGKFNLAALIVTISIIILKFIIFKYFFALPFNGNQFIISILLGYIYQSQIVFAGLFSILVTLFTILFFGLMITSFMSGGQYNHALGFLHQVTRPLLRPLQKIIPPIGGAIDITPVIVLFVLFYLQGLLVKLGLQFL